MTPTQFTHGARGTGMRARRPAWAVSALAGLAGLFLAAAVTAPAPAPAFPGERWWEDSRDMSLEARRQRREQFSEAFRARVGDAYSKRAPLVSQETIDAMGAAVARYRRIVSNGGWRTLPEGRSMRLKDFGNHVWYLRHHLAQTGDLREESRRARLFDRVLQDAVARFQLRHGLRVTGFVDNSTLRALNVPARERLRQLETNLARLQDLYQITQSERYVLVNVPSYTLEAVEQNRLDIESRVVVGKPSRETPSVSAKIQEVNFFPYWRVPDSIARRDLIPQIRKDPSYFHEQKFSVLPKWGADPIPPQQINWSSQDIYSRKFRQDPGPQNALGVVRINMPNKHIVYLHDTPLKELFQQNSRSFSSGCVRVQRVLDLVGWLLKDQGDWSTMRVNVTVALGESQDVKLKEPVPVHFVYVTSWAASNGLVFFRPDIYGRDGAQVELADAADGEAAQQGFSGITP